MKMARVGCSPGIAESEAESEVVGLGRRESVRRESERDVRADIPYRKGENPLQLGRVYKLEGAPPRNRSSSVAGNGVLFTHAFGNIFLSTSLLWNVRCTRVPRSLIPY